MPDSIPSQVLERVFIWQKFVSGGGISHTSSDVALLTGIQILNMPLAIITLSSASISLHIHIPDPYIP